MKNKGSLLFWAFLLAFLIGTFLFQYNTPKKFVWNPSYSKYDKQPFGSYVFDDVVSSSVDNYSLVNKTFYQLYLEYSEDYYYEDEYDEDSYREEEGDSSDYKYAEGIDEFDEDTIVPLPEDERLGILLTEESADFTGTDVNALLRLVKQGHTVMLCMGSFPAMLRDSLCFDTTYDSFFSSAFIERYAKEGNQRDSLFFGSDSMNPERIYTVYPHLHPVYIVEGYNTWERDSSEQDERIICDSLETLVWNGKKQPVIMRLFVGAGELFLVTTPLLFTNYGILDNDNASYAFRLLSYMEDKPIIRLEAYGVNNQPSGSPLRYLLNQPSLRWALYLTMIVLILFMVFTAKRRQRIIPVVHPPANQTLRFTQLIGNLYYQKRNYKDIIQKKYLYFCTEVKQLNGLDLQSDEPDEELCHRLADKMGLDFAEIWPEFRELKHLLRDGRVVTEDEMTRNLDRMNVWMNNLYN